MALSYHNLKILAQDTMDTACKNPDPGGRLRTADMHFADGAHKHAMVHILTQPDIETAIKCVMEDRDIERSAARSAITAAIENAPSAWQNDKNFLYSRGIVKIEKKFFILPPELLKDSLFDGTRSQLSPEAKKILDQTLKASLTGRLSGNISIGTSTVQYVAAQLVTDKSGREFRLSALSAERSRPVDADHLYNSSRAIRHFAKELDINLAEIGVTLREGEARTQKPKPAVQPETPQAVKPLTRVHQVAGIAPPKSPPVDVTDTKGDLRRALERHVAEESVTPKEAAVYFFMAGTLSSIGPTTEEAARKFGLSQEEVEAVLEDVSGVLYGPPVPAPQKLTVKR